MDGTTADQKLFLGFDDSRRLTVSGRMGLPSMFRKSSHNRVPFGLFVLSISVLMTASFFDALCVSRLINEYRTVATAHDVIETLRTARATLERQAALLQTYLITNDPNTLDRYREQLSEATTNILKLDTFL